jgi:hypothetical protein
MSAEECVAMKAQMDAEYVQMMLEAGCTKLEAQEELEMLEDLKAQETHEHQSSESHDEFTDADLEEQLALAGSQ